MRRIKSFESSGGNQAPAESYDERAASAEPDIDGWSSAEGGSNYEQSSANSPSDEQAPAESYKRRKR